ncbi:hypothetical protein BC833DRAFT_625198 [Globomyces pollinis-pini]|nr:hypothetical protein BC833DRAFT_625198 [Globomyces pollinis-pini]
MKKVVRPVPAHQQMLMKTAEGITGRVRIPVMFEPPPETNIISKNELRKKLLVTLINGLISKREDIGEDFGPTELPVPDYLLDAKDSTAKQMGVREIPDCLTADKLRGNERQFAIHKFFSSRTGSFCTKHCHTTDNSPSVDNSEHIMDAPRDCSPETAHAQELPRKSDRPPTWRLIVRKVDLDCSYEKERILVKEKDFDELINFLPIFYKKGKNEWPNNCVTKKKKFVSFRRLEKNAAGHVECCKEVSKYFQHPWAYGIINQKDTNYFNVFNCNKTEFKVFAMSAEKKNKRTKIEKLNSDNFSIWKTTIQLVLEDMGMWNDGVEKEGLEKVK